MENSEKELMRLKLSSPESVFEWLKKNKPKHYGIGKKSLDWKEAHSRDIENSLYERKEPLINLGLALYGLNCKVSEQIFLTGDQDLKLAVCSGPSFYISDWLESGNYLKEMIQDFDDRSELEDYRFKLDDYQDKSYPLLPTLVRNEYLPESLLIKIIKKTGPFEKLTNLIHQKLFMMCCIDNKRFAKVYSDKTEVEKKSLDYIYITKEDIELFGCIYNTIFKGLNDIENNILNVPNSKAKLTVKKWYKAVGDAVAIDEVICEVETDKAIIEVAASTAGILEQITASEGDNINVDALLGKIDETANGTTKNPASIPVSIKAEIPLEPAYRYPRSFNDENENGLMLMTVLEQLDNIQWDEDVYGSHFWQIQEKIDIEFDIISFIEKWSQLSDVDAKYILKDGSCKQKIQGNDEVEFPLDDHQTQLALANCIPEGTTEFASLVHHQLFSLRRTYYRRFTPKSKKELETCYKQDQNKFLYQAIQNFNIFANPVTKKALKKLIQKKLHFPFLEIEQNEKGEKYCDVLYDNIQRSEKISFWNEYSGWKLPEEFLKKKKKLES